MIGNRVSGKPYSLNLSKLSPVLINGKSHLVLTILSGLTNKFSPEDLKLCLIDPETSCYENSPYLMAPVAKVANDILALLTLIDHEMRERYYAFSLYGAKNFEDYRKKGHPKLPYILVVFDDFNRISPAHRRMLDSEIIFLSRMLKAAGMYLILITSGKSDPMAQFMNTLITLLNKGEAEVKFSKKRDVITVA